MVKTKDSVLEMGRNMISLLRNNEEFPAPLDYSPDSFQFCQWYLESLSDSDDIEFNSRTYTAIAVYIGDYFMRNSEGFEYEIVWDDDADSVKDIQLIGNSMKISLLGLVLSASESNDGIDIPKKVSFLNEEIDKIKV